MNNLWNIIKTSLLIIFVDIIVAGLAFVVLTLIVYLIQRSWLQSDTYNIVLVLFILAAKPFVYRLIAKEYVSKYNLSKFQSIIIAALAAVTELVLSIKVFYTNNQGSSLIEFIIAQVLAFFLIYYYFSQKYSPVGSESERKSRVFMFLFLLVGIIFLYIARIHNFQTIPKTWLLALLAVIEIVLYLYFYKFKKS